MNRIYIYYWVYTDGFGNYNIVRYKTLDGVNYVQDSIVQTTDTDYQNYIAEGNTPTVVTWVAPALTPLKQSKIIYLITKVGQIIQNTQYATVGNPLNGLYFDLQNQIAALSGVTGYNAGTTPTYLTALKTIMNSYAAKLSPLISQINSMSYSGLTNMQIQTLINTLNAIDIS